MKLWRRLKSDNQYIKGLLAISNTSKMLKPDGDFTVADDLEERFERFGNRTAIEFEGDTVTYSELDARANKFANWAISAGLEQGDCVALFMENDPDYVAFWIGMLKAGLTCALINTNLVGEGLAHCLDIVNANVVVTTHERVQSLSDVRELTKGRLQIWSLKGGGHGALNMDSILGDISDKRPDPSVRQNVKSADTALYIYTSGTTGLPKAAKITHIRTIGFMRTFVPPCKIDENDRIYLTLPLYHATGGVCGVGSALQTGATILLRKRFSASSFWKDAKETECNHVRLYWRIWPISDESS